MASGVVRKPSWTAWIDLLATRGSLGPSCGPSWGRPCRTEARLPNWGVFCRSSAGFRRRSARGRGHVLGGAPQTPQGNTQREPLLKVGKNYPGKSPGRFFDTTYKNCITFLAGVGTSWAALESLWGPLRHSRSPRGPSFRSPLPAIPSHQSTSTQAAAQQLELTAWALQYQIRNHEANLTFLSYSTTCSECNLLDVPIPDPKFRLA